MWRFEAGLCPSLDLPRGQGTFQDISYGQRPSIGSEGGRWDGDGSGVEDGLRLLRGEVYWGVHWGEDLGLGVVSVGRDCDGVGSVLG